MVGFGLYFLNSYLEGGAYTEQEHLDWLEPAGFVEIERTILPDAWSFIRARKPA